MGLQRQRWPLLPGMPQGLAGHAHTRLACPNTSAQGCGPTVSMPLISSPPDTCPRWALPSSRVQTGSAAGPVKGSKVGATVTIEVHKPEGLLGQLTIGPIGAHQRCIYGRLPTNDVVRAVDGGVADVGA